MLRSYTAFFRPSHGPSHYSTSISGQTPRFAALDLCSCHAAAVTGRCILHLLGLHHATCTTCVHLTPDTLMCRLATTCHEYCTLLLQRFLLPLCCCHPPPCHKAFAIGYQPQLSRQPSSKPRITITQLRTSTTGKSPSQPMIIVASSDSTSRPQHGGRQKTPLSHPGLQRDAFQEQRPRSLQETPVGLQERPC